MIRNQPHDLSTAPASGTTGAHVPVEFRLLGEFEVIRARGCPVDVGHARQRVLLASMLADAGRCVTADQLLERAWGDERPRGGRDTLYSYLSRLRQALRSVTEVSIGRRHGGYVLHVDPMTVDLHRFRRWIDAAGRLDDVAARPLLERATALWHGEALTRLDTPWLNSLREQLELQRHAAEARLANIKLGAGLHGELVTTLVERAERHPMDEQLAGQLMLALYRSGRAAEALQQYRRIRHRIRQELGVEPSTPLARLHQRMLTADPTLWPSASWNTPAGWPRGGGGTPLS
ncbi:AfsR/SARP family transcriptional regulator [Streptomyces hainanensis]|uniref:AfsR/SARP family transcriptional regulator n=1 Tax=Streptomyces hainanensis TaxID=402648 RepID=A0A4R4TLU4_9ACTN|nr:AfsR/SARP family transcriptional regulator [Streptomyces hainanensis]TDC78971.1 AfsR/SARP family transcriptional regulator [Streptomyces hainanensis]